MAPLTTLSAPTPSPKSVVSIKLPTLALVHILSLAGVCTGTYQIVKPNTVTATETQQTIASLKQEIDQSRLERAAILERLARIETNGDNIRESLRELRQAAYQYRNQSNTNTLRQ